MFQQKIKLREVLFRLLSNLLLFLTGFWTRKQLEGLYHRVLGLTPLETVVGDITRNDKNDRNQDIVREGKYTVCPLIY